MVLNVTAQFCSNFNHSLGEGVGVDPSHSHLIAKVQFYLFFGKLKESFLKLCLINQLLNIFKRFVTLILEVILVRDLVMIV